MWILILQRTVFDFFLDVLYFPVWWYSAGAKRVLVGSWHRLEDASSMLAPWLWLRNIFVPMFGQSDWQGRITSFLVRFFNVIIRGIGLFLFAILLIALFFFWVAFPMIVIYFLSISFL